MPTYEYRCPNGHLFELFQRMDDPPPDGCDECGDGPLTKVLHPVPVFFKGSGFYSTDYGRGSKKRDSSGDSEKPKPDEGAKKTDKDEKKKAEA